MDTFEIDDEHIAKKFSLKKPQSSEIFGSIIMGIENGACICGIPKQMLKKLVKNI